MDAVLRFSPALSDWVLHNLRQGCAPANVIKAMCAQDMPPEAAKAIVDAFVFALRTGSPVPVDSVTVAPLYQYEPPRLPPGTSIRTTDRLVRVAARAAQPAMAVLDDVFDARECEELIALARPGWRHRPPSIRCPGATLSVNSAAAWACSSGCAKTPSSPGSISACRSS